MPTIDITIDFSLSGSDPGRVPGPAGPNCEGQIGYLKPVILESNQSIGPDSDFLIEVKKADTVLIFSFANAQKGADPQFVGFRYYNTGKKWWKSGWFTPGGLGAIEFRDRVISLPDRQRMAVIDRTHNHTLYFFVVEWSEMGPAGKRIYYCCDPKIKNEPGGGEGRKVTLWGWLKRTLRRLLSRAHKALS